MTVSRKTGNLYFVAIIPPDPFYEETLSFKREIRDRFGSKGALRSPPHITLHMPFRLSDREENEAIAALEESANGQSPFELRLDGFGSFPPRVIYVNVEKNQRLQELHVAVSQTLRRNLSKINATYRDQGYTPHLTIGFRDLKKSDFHKAWPEFAQRDYNAFWMVKSFWLLKHSGQEWAKHREFMFEG